MSYLLKLLLTIAIIGLLFGSVAVFVGLTPIGTQLSHLPAFFAMLAGNAYLMNDTFPVYDTFLAFSAVLSVEILILIFKLGRWIMRLLS